ncbi:MAG: DUF58 domain-containing protein [Pirellulales bacterium]
MSPTTEPDRQSGMWLLAVIASLLVATLFGLSLLAFAVYALVGVILLSRYLARTWAANVTGQREMSRQVARIGETVAVSVSVWNGGQLPIVWLLVEDLLPRTALVHDPPNLRVRQRRSGLWMLKGRGGKNLPQDHTGSLPRPEDAVVRRGLGTGSKTLYYQLECNRRGYYQIGPLVVETGDLFGLHRRHRAVVPPQFLTVHPRIIPLNGYAIASRRPIGDVRLTHRLFEDPTRATGVRPYAPGDPLSRIHWRATAATGRLHSKQYEPSTVRGATVLLDFHQVSFPPEHEPFRSELAVTATASLVGALYESGHPAGLITNGRDAADRIRREGATGALASRADVRLAAGMSASSHRLEPVRVETRRGPEQLLRMLNALARLELTNGLSFAELVQETLSRIPRDASVVAVLTRVTGSMAIALGMLRRQGLTVTAVLNVYDESEFAEASGPLLTEGVTTRHLKDEAAVATVCGDVVLS